MTIRASVVLLALVALACGKQSSAPAAEPEAEFSLAQAADSVPLPLGRVVRVGEVLMLLADVPSDSRCPRNVQCVSAGDAVASIVVHPPCFKAGCRAPSAALELHTTLEPKVGEAWGHRVQLLSLLPERTTTDAPDKARYVAWVRVSK